MNGTVFDIGITDCGYTMAAFVRNNPHYAIGTFWLPSTPEASDRLGGRWVDYVLTDNQAQAILDDIDDLEREPALHTHMIILLTSSPLNPGDYSFMAGITRFLESRELLVELAKYNIPAHTECTYPELFSDREIEMNDYQIWEELSLADWNEYIRRTLVSRHGKQMLEAWWERLKKSRR